MALRTIEYIKQFWDSYINTNSSQSITGQIMNEAGNDIADSFISKAVPQQTTWLNDTDPTTVSIPPAGNYYQGIFNDKRWLKNDAGEVFYSSSGVWVIFDSVETNIVLDVLYLDNLLKWEGTANGTITLDNSVLQFDEGWHTAIYNNTPDLNILIQAGGTDILKSHNEMFYIPSYSYASLGLINVNGVTEWYCTIEQTFKYGVGSVANGAVGLTVPVLANTWTEIGFVNPVYGDIKNVAPGATPGRLRINYPDQGTNNVYVSISGHLSADIPGADQVLDFTFGIDGAVSSLAEAVRQTAGTSGVQSAGIFFPLSFSFEGLVTNGSEVSLFMRLTDSVSIEVIATNFQIKVDSLQGVNIDVI